MNSSGALGDGTRDARNTPVDVVGLGWGVTAVSAGGGHTCALLETGGVKCWGYNEDGQLGNSTETRTFVETPVDVSDLTSGVIAISAGHNHTCALLETGGVKCWGSNQHSQIGSNASEGGYSRTPVDIVGLDSGVLAISAGGTHTCALLDTRGVKCWGHNDVGQLGNGTDTSFDAPVDVSGLGGLASGVSWVSAGDGFTFVLLDDGRVKSWGHNYHGQLGDGTRTHRFAPVDVSGL
jgi:alpha-tubulin suppressor-like RCC1 family protein